MNLYLLSFLLTAVCWTEVAARNKIIIVAMSGLRHDYVDQPGLPTFRKFKLNGVQAKQMEIPFVTNSWPSLWTMATGLWPEEHGVIDDSMMENKINAPFRAGNTRPDTNWMQYRPIWIAAEEAGIQTAVSGWPGSFLTYGSLNASEAHKYVTRETDETARTRITEFAGWMYSGADLGLILFPEPDNSGHQHGAESDAVKDAVKRNDALLQFLLDSLKARDGLDKTTNIIVVGDHGMVDHSSDHVIYLSDLNIRLGDFKWITNNLFTTGMLVPHDDRIDSVYGNLTSPEGQLHMVTYKREDLPEEFHLKNHRRTPPIIVIPDKGYRIEITRPHSDLQFTTRINGLHGYNNSHPEMRPAMLAMGPDFKQRKQVKTFHSNEIYPMVCSLLKLTTCHGSDGRMDNPGIITTVPLIDQRKTKLDYTRLNTEERFQKKGRPTKLRHKPSSATTATSHCMLLLFMPILSFLYTIL